MEQIVRPQIAAEVKGVEGVVGQSLNQRSPQDAEKQAPSTCSETGASAAGCSPEQIVVNDSSPSISDSPLAG